MSDNRLQCRGEFVVKGRRSQAVGQAMYVSTTNSHERALEGSTIFATVQPQIAANNGCILSTNTLGDRHQEVCRLTVSMYMAGVISLESSGYIHRNGHSILMRAAAVCAL
jgi:hypothetical protein